MFGRPPDMTAAQLGLLPMWPDLTAHEGPHHLMGLPHSAEIGSYPVLCSGMWRRRRLNAHALMVVI